MLYSNIQEQGYELAYKLACEQLAGMNIEQQCHKSGAQYVDSNKIIIDYLNQSYLINLPSIEISYAYFRSSGSLDPEPREEIPLKDKILMLHYLTLAKGTPISNKLITFKQLPGCASYSSVFDQLAIKPLLNHFGKEPELLIDAAAKLGGRKAGYGDIAVTINAFPKVPITIVLWRGGDEFAPRGSIMFDSNIPDYLTAEDIRELCATMARRLVNLGNISSKVKNSPNF